MPDMRSPSDSGPRRIGIRTSYMPWPLVAFGVVGLLSCGRPPVDQAALFQSDKPLKKGTEVVGLGTVGRSNSPGHADLSLLSFADCRDVEPVGDFDIVLDDKGKELAGKDPVAVFSFRGELTGNARTGIVFTPSTSLKSENGKAVTQRVPELIVREFRAARDTDITCRKG